MNLFKNLGIIMLDDYKRNYIECANLVDNWKQLDINTLGQRYLEALECNDDMYINAYLSAIVLKYWRLIQSSYYSQKVRLASEEDVYEWVLEGILDALEHHVWTDVNNSLYGDENAVDKAINVCIYSSKLNFFKSLDYEKRRINKYSISLDEIQENASDDYFLPYFDKSPYAQIYLSDRIKTLFKGYNYFSAFLLDAIINADVFINEKDNAYRLSNRKLIGHLRSIDDNYCKIISDTYDVDFKEVKQAAAFVKNIDTDRMARNIENLLRLFRYDKSFIKYLKDN